MWLIKWCCDIAGSNLKGEDVILASSIGLFVGIIAGVVALIVLFAVIVLCCCCKPFKSQQLVYKTSTPQSAAQQPALPTGQSGSITVYWSEEKAQAHKF